MVLIGVHERRKRVTANRSALELRDVARLGCEGSMKPAGAFRLKRDGGTHYSMPAISGHFFRPGVEGRPRILRAK